MIEWIFYLVLIILLVPILFRAYEHYTLRLIYLKAEEMNRLKKQKVKRK